MASIRTRGYRDEVRPTIAIGRLSGAPPTPYDMSPLYYDELYYAERPMTIACLGASIMPPRLRSVSALVSLVTGHTSTSGTACAGLTRTMSVRYRTNSRQRAFGTAIPTVISTRSPADRG